jgi:hypothetical protein
VTVAGARLAPVTVGSSMNAFTAARNNADQAARR